MLAASSATFIGFSMGRIKTFGPIVIPSASGAMRARRGIAWIIWSGLVRKWFGAQSEANPASRARRVCATSPSRWAAMLSSAGK